MIRLDLTELAEQQLIREGKEPTGYRMIMYAHKIAKWMDKHPKATLHILNGGIHKSKKAKHIFKKKYGIT